MTESVSGSQPHHRWRSSARSVVLNRTIGWCSKPQILSDLVSVEHWRLQVRLGPSTSTLRTFELRRDPLSEQWLLESLTTESIFDTLVIPA